MSKISHEPVLLKEVIEALHIKNLGRYIDATLGAGGYTNAILDKGGLVLGLDTDESMIQVAKNNLKSGKAEVVHSNFIDIKKVAEEKKFTKVDGIVFDLGVSNFHFMDENRGFSFKNKDADLDMRLNPKSQGVKASDLLNVLRFDQLSKMLGKKLAEKVIETRKTKMFKKVGDFLELFPEKRGKLHPATLGFLNLRIAVNSELENLRSVLPDAYDLLNIGGKLAVVSFNSLEDEIVKNFIKTKGGENKIIRPSEEELKRNPKSRSAILRVLEKK